jgi:hypothetical protein
MPTGTTWKGPMTFAQPFAWTIQTLASAGAGTTTIDCTLGGYVVMTFSAATRTIAAPLNARTGARLVLDITNSSGGALTITWNAAFKQAAVAPATTKRRVYDFTYDGTNWVQSGIGVDL